MFSVCESWGCVEFDDVCYRISILGEPLVLNSISVPNAQKITSVTVDGAKIDFEVTKEKVIFENKVIRKELYLTY